MGKVTASHTQLRLFDLYQSRLRLPIARHFKGEHGCPHCVRVALMAGTHAQKRYRRGTQRVVAPAETLARMRPFFSELGITRVANVTGLDAIGIPTVMVTRPNGRSLSVHQGKGAELAAAQASGIMEAAEHHLAEHIARAPTLATAIQIAERGRVVELASLPRSVVELRPDDTIGWMMGEDLATGEAVWVPHEMVHLDLRLPLPAGSGHFALGSNGLASGNRQCEAVIHGVCELIERDALTLFYQEPAAVQAMRRVALASVDDPLCAELLQRFEAAGVEVAIWDVTSDLSVPCMFCMVADRQPDTFRPVGSARGSGAHVERAVALSRALCEAAQSRLTQIVGARDDLQAGALSALRSDEATTRALAQMRAGEALRRFEQTPSLADASWQEDIDYLLARLHACGMCEVLVVDLSRAEIPCSVVRVIVPGLESVFASPSYRPGLRARQRQQALA
jgi:YcaO-like protein with predicted kinase domain